MSFVIAGNSASTGYNLTRSLRFRASASAYLNRTPSVAGNRQTWTYSVWAKLGAAVGTSNYNILMARTSASYYTGIYFNANNLYLDWYNSTQIALVRSSQVFRDPSAWYHIVIAVNTTSATSSNRILMYVNGTQVTAFTTATYPPQNAQTAGINEASIATWISSDPAYPLQGYYDGYLAEVNFIDGQALTPSSFGSTNALTGVWQPAAYSGSYGTNGFYLPFTDNSLPSTYAGSFNGTNKTITFSGISNLAFGSSDYTVEFLVNLSATGQQVVYASGDGVTAVNNFFFSVHGTYVGVGTQAVWISQQTTTLSTGVWYNIAASRSGGTLRLFVNGTQIGSSVTDSTSWLSSGTGAVGSNGAGTQYINGSISNVRVIKGTALYTSNYTPAIAPFTAVTNTQLLTMQNSSIVDNSANAISLTNVGSVATSVVYPYAGNNLGLDFSGNGNYWTTNNISITAGVTYDSMTDVPTLTDATASNFAVLNPLTGDGTISNANLTIDWVGGNSSKPATIGVTSGKWYCEITLVAAATNAMFAGIIPASMIPSASYPGSASGGYGFFGDGQKYFNGVNSAYGTAISVGQIVGIAFDLDNGKLWFSRNGTWQASGDPAAGTNAAFTSIAAGTWFLSTGHSGSCTLAANFGQRPFTYTPPTGFVALNTYNLPTSTIVKGNTVMDATLYTGTGASLSVTNAAAFKPDLVWNKQRSAVRYHDIYDSVRGVTAELSSNSTDQEQTISGVTAFNSNGFTLGSNDRSNVSAGTYVSWQWQAGQGSSSSNTNGTITSTVSVNASAGFSVVTWTNNNTANQSIGHGLGVAPALVVTKDRDNGTYNWATWFTGFTANEYLLLNTTGAKASYSTLWYQVPDSSKFYIGSTGTGLNAGTDKMVAYCWTPIAGYSAFGSYTGNGSTDGTFVYTGFRPKFVIIKRTDTTGDWYTFDTSRDPYNATAQGLSPNSSASETTYTGWGDLLSNGFKIRRTDGAWNASGGTYIYMAFAETPFKNSLGR